MNVFRLHWFDIGLGLALLTGIFLALVPLSPWLSLISLFLHQAEEYRYPGYFPVILAPSTAHHSPHKPPEWNLLPCHANE
jgi:hypothetical protein